MKLNWGVSLGIVYSIFAIAMILFAIKASNQKYDLVSDNYYDDAVNYQSKINAKNNAIRSGSSLTLNYLINTNQLSLLTKGVQNNLRGILYFYKPDRAADDFKLDFLTDITGSQLIKLNTMAHGFWKINATWKIDGKDYSEESRIFIP